MHQETKEMDKESEREEKKISVYAPVKLLVPHPFHISVLVPPAAAPAVAAVKVALHPIPTGAAVGPAIPTTTTTARRSTSVRESVWLEANTSTAPRDANRK